ncbi:alpha-galactosidase [Bianquea renquensis]|uniref:Alpha-galactosidase n=1 Tax=Bianquea renquensis TaxID=2763661 RepID=A0A926DU79_9FIRM|nr:alpha-galactosidase [Bianquea renquensis]MBC8543464.1 alpha-galactosidase [Bianquea renquensis]
MSIYYEPDHALFCIQTAHTTYAFALNAESRPVHLYWGAKLQTLSDLALLTGNLHVETNGDSSFRLRTNNQYEYRAGEPYSYEEQALDLFYSDGVRGAQLAYRSHVISADGRALAIELADGQYPLSVTLRYEIYPDLDLITRRAVIRNEGSEPLHLRKMQSASFHFPRGVQYRVTHFAGNWGAEYQKQQEMLPLCRTVIQNNHGNTSGPHAVPFFALDPWGKADDTSGEVFFGTLHWSGDFKITCERTELGAVSVTAGVNDEQAAVTLHSGESYETPEITAGFTTGGFGGMSEQLYDFQLDHLLPQKRAHNVIPVIYNSWYAYDFRIDEEKILGLMDRAAELGVELFVIDDGWMPGRDCDSKGLGDWVPDPLRFPNGLRVFAERAHAQGMKFGLWIEPEMVNPDSDLFRAHPDWVLQSESRPQTTSRNQLVLNLAREDVLAYVLDVLDRTIQENELDYLKWDMNRYITDWGWPTGSKEQREKLPLTMIENIYGIWTHLNEAYPDLLLENCAHGGARSDYGMVRYTDRINRSDNATPADVLLLHEGFSTLFVPKSAGGAGTFNGTPGVPYAFRENLGFTGSMSIGVNLLRCSQEELNAYGASVAQFKRERADLQNSYVYHLVSAWNSPYAVWQYVRRDRQAFTVFGFCFGRHFPDDRMARVRLTGLIPEAFYECVVDTCSSEVDGQRYTGEALMQIGLQLPLERNYDSVRLVFRRVM